MSPPIMVVMGLSYAVLIAFVVFAAWGIAGDADPFRAGLAPAWMVTIVFGLLVLRIGFVAARMLRARGMARIDDEGVTNVKDGIGPIAWEHIIGATIEALPYVPRAGNRSALFLQVPDAVARRHIQAASLLARWSRYPAAGGLTRIPLMEAPPHTVPQLEQALEQIRSRAGLGRPNSGR